MEDTLISFETAKLAKEKGFNIGCKNKYVETLEHALEMGRGGDCTFPHIPTRVLTNSSYEKWDIVHCDAPTQSLLQRWLREVHNIYVESYHDLTSDGTKIQFYTSWGFLQQKDKNGNRNVNGWYDEYNDWKTYEEALEIGLQEGLKLLSDEFY